MKFKEKECAWPSGTQETDVTYVGEHTWAEIARARKEASERDGPGAPTGLLMVLGLGLVALILGGLLLY